MSGSGDGGRWHAVDHVKAAAIVAVVFTHAGDAGLGGARTSVDSLLTLLWTRFHVPSFLFVSGFLYASSSPLPWGSVGRRLQRVLRPYLLWSVVAMTVGLALGTGNPPWVQWPTLVRSGADVVRQLLSASALGVYYYVLLIAVCIPLSWPLSRSGRWGAWFVCVGSFVLAVGFDTGEVTRPASWLASSFGGSAIFWAMRDPLEQFSVGYFAAGWLAALHLPELRRFGATHPALALGLCCAGVLFGWAAFLGLLSTGSNSSERVVYSLAVVGLITLATHRRVAGGVVRFLGDASLGIYLLHRIFQLLAQPITGEWPAVARILAQVVVGLGGASLVLWAGRALLGEVRARQWLGA